MNKPMLALAITLALSGLPATAAESAALADVKKMNTAFADVAGNTSPAVVNIYTKSGAKRFLPKQMPRDPEFEFYFGGNMPSPPREALGSGFIVNAKEGYIVTNAHVVRMAGKNADQILVKLAGEENSKGHLANVIGVDEVTDVALLKLVDKRLALKQLPLGDSAKSKVGEWVLAIGNPYGHTHTVTQGIVSAVGRALDGARAEFMQTSASINPGNSGGPLVNMDGEVIGITTAMDPRAQGIGFAIPINVAKTVIDQLASKGKVARAWMGVGIDDLNEDVAGYMKLKNPEGVLVREVMPKQPADAAGMEVYDVIVKINDKPVRNVRDLYRSVENIQVGQSANIEVIRNNQPHKLKVKFGGQPSA